MRIAIIVFGQETNSFSPLQTSLDKFRRCGIYEGNDILEKFHDNGIIGGFLSALKEEKKDYNVLPIIRGWGRAGGIIDGEVIEYFTKKIVAGIKKAGSLDGVFFAIHGAAQSEKIDDVEGYLLKKVRTVIGPHIPIVCPMDHHGNITKLKMEMSTALIGHLDQPHDTFDTGYRAAKILFKTIYKSIRPVMAWQKIPIITHQEQFCTSSGPMKEWFDMARNVEKEPGVVSVSNFPMQPWLDAYEGGYSTVVITDNNVMLAQTLSTMLSKKVFDLRDRLIKRNSVSLEKAVREAEESPKGIVILSDTGDSIFGGGTGDSTWILDQMLKQCIKSEALVPIVDSDVVNAAVKSGLGSRITVTIGGKIDTIFQKSINITGRVTKIGGGRIKASIFGLESFDMGKAVIIEKNSIKLLVTEFPGIGGNHPVAYQHFGIDPSMAKIIVVKTAANWQYFNKWMIKAIRVDTPGVTMSSLHKFNWKRLPRPIWPLDDVQFYYP